MVRVTDAQLDAFIAEDVPYIDLTTEVMGIGSVFASMEFYTREKCLLCGSEESARIAERLGCEVESFLPSGASLDAGDSFLRVSGPASALHMAWKVCLNMVDSTSAVATKTATMVKAVHGANPDCEVLATRKLMPGTKSLMTKAVMVGGAYPHRLGLSETVLVFDHHIDLMGGMDAFLAELPQIKRRCIEKKVFVEAGPHDAVRLAKAGVDGLQFDKVPAGELTDLVAELRSIDPRLTLIAAGGINPSNAASYAVTGVDGVATTCLYSAKPLDMRVRMWSVD